MMRRCSYRSRCGMFLPTIFSIIRTKTWKRKWCSQDHWRTLAEIFMNKGTTMRTKPRESSWRMTMMLGFMKIVHCDKVSFFSSSFFYIDSRSTTTLVRLSLEHRLRNSLWTLTQDRQSFGYTVLSVIEKVKPAEIVVVMTRAYRSPTDHTVANFV